MTSCFFLNILYKAYLHIFYARVLGRIPLCTLHNVYPISYLPVLSHTCMIKVHRQKCISVHTYMCVVYQWTEADHRQASTYVCSMQQQWQSSKQYRVNPWLCLCVLAGLLYFYVHAYNNQRDRLCLCQPSRSFVPAVMVNYQCTAKVITARNTMARLDRKYIKMQQKLVDKKSAMLYCHQHLQNTLQFRSSANPQCRSCNSLYRAPCREVNILASFTVMANTCKYSDQYRLLHPLD